MARCADHFLKRRFLSQGLCNLSSFEKPTWYIFAHLSPNQYCSYIQLKRQRVWIVMVGTRRNLLKHGSDYGSINETENGNGFDKYQRVDLESGYGSINPVHPKQRFRDAISQTIHENRAIEMKKQLIENVDHNELEHFRKSEESVRFVASMSQEL
jgi:hypothetical protein